jgi:hypothetical protein
VISVQKEEIPSLVEKMKLNAMRIGRIDKSFRDTIEKNVNNIFNQNIHQ